MKKSTLFPFFLCLLTPLAFAESNGSQGLQAISAVARAKVSQFVQKQLATQNEIPVFVIMKTQANLETAVRGFERRTHAQRVQAVYQALVQHANSTQPPVLKLLNDAKAQYYRYFISNSILIRKADAALINQIAKLPSVGKIIGNPSVQRINPPASPSDFMESSSMMLQNPANSEIGQNILSTGAHKVWSDLKVMGENIVVAGQDTGYQWDHPGLKENYRGWNAANKSVNHDYSWHDSIHFNFSPQDQSSCEYDSKAPCDDNKHGTHTMGTILGNEGMKKNLVGMAPKAKWIGCRNMDAGWGNPASYLECFQFFLAPTPVGGDAFTQGRPEFAPHVINNSWGCTTEEGCEGDEMLPALKAMKAAGIMVVVSAGNEGPGCSTMKAPPSYHNDWVLTVGAHNHRDGSIASFSSRGPSLKSGRVGPEVTAPGVKIRSTVPGGAYEDMASILSPWSGTSMAGPHVAGLVALMWSANPNLVGKIDETVQLIRDTAKKTTSSQNCGNVKGTEIPNNTFGYGMIQALDAVNAAKSSTKIRARK